MKVIGWEDFVAGPGLEKPIAATVGVFDGLHLGHRHLIESVFAHREGRLASVFTFRENPKRVVRPTSFKGSLSSLQQKLELLESVGLDLCVLIDFSGNFSKLAGREFLSLLREKGRLEYMAIGSNFSCGHRLDTDSQDIAAYYKAQGILTEVLEPMQWEGYAVSSSRIRVAIMDGRLEDAVAMLGRRYELDLSSFELEGEGQGGFRYKRPPEFVLPPEGSYEVELRGASGRTEGLLAVFDDGLALKAPREDNPERVAFIGLQRV